MRRVLLFAALLCCAGGAFTAAQAQKVAPLVTRDADHDGVPDIRDRCRDTPAGTRVDANGCPTTQAAAPAPAVPTAQRTPAPAVQRPGAPAGAPAGAAPTGGPPTVPAAPVTQAAGNAAAPKTLAPPAGLPTSGAPAAQPGPVVANQSVPPAGAAPSGANANRPANPPANAVTPVPVVTPPVVAPTAQPTAQPPQPAAQPPAQPAAQPPAAQPAATPGAPPAVAPTAMTAGFGVPAFTARNDNQRLEYGRMVALKLDSAVVALVDLFRGTTGMPLPGASSPDVLSMREKRRWGQCRLIAYDVAAISDAVREMKNSIPGGPTVSRAALTLADALGALVATGECDNLGSMIEAPDRWAPWQGNYETSVRNFFRDWYGQLRAVHEADRAFARALNPALPAGRQFPVPAGLPPTPPTVGGGR